MAVHGLPATVRVVVVEDKTVPVAAGAYVNLLLTAAGVIYFGA